MNNYIKLLYCAIFFCFIHSSFVFAVNTEENSKRKNSFYLEMGGNAGTYSINYDLIFYHKNQFSIGGRAGFAIIPTNTCPTVFPVEIYGLYGKSKHYFEYGLGYSPVIYLGKNSLEPSEMLLFRLGYRYQKKQGGFMFRAGFTPIVKNADDKIGEFRFTPFAGISLGWTF